LKTRTVFPLKNTSVHYNAGVVVVNSDVVGLDPGVNSIYYNFFYSYSAGTVVGLFAEESIKLVKNAS
jgi:hypothetical protein